LRPRIAGEIFQPFGRSERVDVDLDTCGRMRFSTKPGERLLVMANTGVDLLHVDPVSAWVATQSALIGRPSLLRPQPPLSIERDEWKKGPEMKLDRKTIVQPRRWFPRGTFLELDHADAFARFVAWRRYVRDVRLPKLTYARTKYESTEFLLISESVLAVEALYRALKGSDHDLQIQEAFEVPEGLLIHDASGLHYVSEVAAAWRGRRRHWKGLAQERTPECQREDSRGLQR
jgi:hypothetical protein